MRVLIRGVRNEPGTMHHELSALGLQVLVTLVSDPFLSVGGGRHTLAKVLLVLCVAGLFRRFCISRMGCSFLAFSGRRSAGVLGYTRLCAFKRALRIPPTPQEPSKWHPGGIQEAPGRFRRHHEGSRSRVGELAEASVCARERVRER